MKSAEDLDPLEAALIVRTLQTILFLDTGKVRDFWNPDKELNSDHMSAIIEIMDEYDLIPERNERELEQEQS